MIDLALSAIAGQLNQALRRAFAVSEDLVVLGNILEQDGHLATVATDKVVVSLVNIERDTTPYQMQAAPGGPQRTPQQAAPVYLTLSVLFAANFASHNYAEALKFISGTIGFFQGRPVMTPANTPELDSRIERLILDLANLSLSDLAHLWGVLSGRYLPSVMYRVRMVAVDLGQLSGQSQPIVDVRTRAATAG